MDRKIYLDHAATTYVKKEVLNEMMPYFSDIFGNPSSAHAFGREAKNAVNIARSRIASVLNADEKEIYFTSGGTESDNWAIKGIAYAHRDKGRHIITTKIEHHAVMDSCEYLGKNGYEITYLPVDEYGLVTPEQVKEAIRPDTILVSIMTANNEIGTIEPIADIGAVTREKGVLFHTDAVQAAGSIPLDVKQLNADLLSISAHKFYGPRGVGALYIRKGVKIEKFLHGGAQERNKRATTENTPGIVGAGYALELAAEHMQEESGRLVQLRDRLIKAVMADIPHAKLNGHPIKRLPGNANFSFQGIEGEALLVMLDMNGIAGSSGSACMSGSFDPSYVLMATGMKEEQARSSVRLTLGAVNTEADIDYTIDNLKEIVQKLRDISPFYEK
jgi:cysteine desulfurase